MTLDAATKTRTSDLMAAGAVLTILLVAARAARTCAFASVPGVAPAEVFMACARSVQNFPPPVAFTGAATAPAAESPAGAAESAAVAAVLVPPLHPLTMTVALMTNARGA